MITGKPSVGQAFDGVKVLDLTHVLAGPFATYQLAVLGAAVLKVEIPENGDMVRPTGGAAALRKKGLGTSFLAQNANKASVALDLSRQEDLEVALRLAQHADVIVENYRPDALAQFGLGYQGVKTHNPRIIYCSISGFGQNGERANHTAYDNVIQASSGLMTVNGTEQTRPVMIGAPVLDYGTGYAAAFAISAALLQRQMTGCGQRIDVAMHDVALTLMSSAIARHLNGDVFPVRDGNTGSNATYGCHATKDGLLMIGAYTPKQSARLWRFLGEPEEAEIVSNLTVVELPQRAKIQCEILSRKLIAESAKHWAERMQNAGIPASPVQTLTEAIEQAELASRPVFADLSGEAGSDESNIRVPLAAFAFDHGGPSLHTPPPLLGKHTTLVRELVRHDPEAAFYIGGAKR
jgi:crotonobetainyl-CoA:carnitine CoA-transferase CaiB-like acyl-CoA transferase